MKSTFRFQSSSTGFVRLLFALEPHLPSMLASIAIGDLLVWEGASESVLVLENDNRDPVRFTEIFRNLFPEASFVELLRLRYLVEHVDEPLCDRLMGELFRPWNFDVDAKFKSVAEKVLNLPKPVLKYFSSKKLFLKDFYFLLPVAPGDLEQTWLPILDHIVRQNFSKSEALQIVDLLGPYLQKIDRDTQILLALPTASAFIEHLRSAVFSRTTSADQSMAEKLEQQSWYQKRFMRWARQGDRSGVELKAVILGPAEAKRFEQAIHPMLDTLTEDSNFWNS